MGIMQPTGVIKQSMRLKLANKLFPSKTRILRNLNSNVTDGDRSLEDKDVTPTIALDIQESRHDDLLLVDRKQSRDVSEGLDATIREKDPGTTKESIKKSELVVQDDSIEQKDNDQKFDQFSKRMNNFMHGNQMLSKNDTG